MAATIAANLAAAHPTPIGIIVATAGRQPACDLGRKRRRPSILSTSGRICARHAELREFDDEFNASTPGPLAE
jgi:hypothetical protein